MPHSRNRRRVALVSGAALLATLTAATVAAPTSAAPSASCRGQAATIVGTNGPDVIIGTNGSDVIAGLGGNDVIKGRGGNDLICGGAGRDGLVGAGGRDRLYGNGAPDNLNGGPGADLIFGGTGDDRLLGRSGNDLLDGGPGTDTCFDLSGSGPLNGVSCELPAPKLLPLSGRLAVAYSDIDGLDGFSTGDVLIAELSDANHDGVPSIGDTIVAGKYPRSLTPGPSEFGNWTQPSHAVTGVILKEPILAHVSVGAADFVWSVLTLELREWYRERGPGLGTTSEFMDADQVNEPTADDSILTSKTSPSQAATNLSVSEAGAGDDRFLEVVLNY